MRILRKKVRPGELVLEVGAGSFGLSVFYPHKFVGCDLRFPCSPRPPMLPVRASGVHLPFRDGTFAAVVASDVLEHVPPDLRPAVIQECLRVSKVLAVIAFPCGRKARALDQELFEYHRSRKLAVPDWLEEHMQFPFPEESLFECLSGGWRAEEFGNESLGFHRWMMRREMSGAWARVLQLNLKLAPSLVERMLAFADRAPFYRKIFVVSRTPKSRELTLDAYA